MLLLGKKGKREALSPTADRHCGAGRQLGVVLTIVAVAAVASAVEDWQAACCAGVQALVLTISAQASGTHPGGQSRTSQFTLSMLFSAIAVVAVAQFWALSKLMEKSRLQKMQALQKNFIWKRLSSSLRTAELPVNRY